MGHMAPISVTGVSKVFPDGTRAVDEVDIDIEDGEFFVLVGPSGCGKSTLLRMIAGLADMSSGTITIGGRDVSELEPRERDIAMVFQDYALYPHLNVYDNLAFGLRRRKTPKPDIDPRVREVARLLAIDDLLHRRPGQLSGGQRQRVAMGRAIARQPSAFLMDEPLSNLDAKLRVQMRTELLRLHQRISTTTIYVTHDQVEAMTMGDRVAVLRDGRLQQVDAPQRIYEQPANLFVAGFIGSPAMNVVEAELRAAGGGDGLEARFGNISIPVPAGRASALRSSGVERVALGLRPQALEDASLDVDSGSPRITVPVELVEHTGSEAIVAFDTGGTPVRTDDVRAALDTDEELPLRTDTVVFLARVHPKSRATAGGQLELAVDTEQLHFFDLDTGAAL
jgi:multiple sugar transport system ATP-binding protein